MSTAVRERPAARRASNGGVPARRAVIRWAVRLLRREWRQQLLILALITVAVAATVVGSAVATNTPSPASAAFGTARDLATFTGSGSHIAAQIASIEHRFGTVDVIENQTLTVPGSIQTYSLRAQNPHGPFGQPTLSLISGRFPVGADQVAVTSGVLAFFLLGWAGSGVGSSSSGSNTAQLQEVAGGFIALVVAVVLLSPACLAVLAGLGRWSPVMARLALRDLARYRARSGPALAAISLSVLIASVVTVVGAARFGDAVDYVGPNLTSSQLIVYPPGHDNPNGPQPTASQVAAAGTAAQRIAASLDDRYMITLEAPSGSLQYDGSGRSWSGTTYLATPRLLRAFGIRPTQVNSDADFLTMRPGLSTTPHMQFWNTPKVPSGTPCQPGSCLANPPIQEIGALPSGTSAPNTVITEHGMREFHLTATTAGWMIQAPGGLTATQVTNARQTAATAGASIETVNNIPSFAQITDVATIFAMVLALGILAMSIGLVRSETASDLRTLTAAGASGTARRTLTAVTAGALALTGAVVGTAAGYLAAIGFFRTNQLDQLSELVSVPVAELLWILVGMPLIAMVVSWLLAGREPPGIARQPLE